jgi:hypothetical protein
MLKRALIAGGGVLLLAALVGGRDAVSYISTSMGWVQQTMKDSVPIEFELERARNLIKELDPEIRSNMHVIAREDVEVARLKEQHEESRKALAKDRADITRLKKDLDEGSGSFVYAGRSYTQKQVETDLTRRFERYKTKEATVEKLGQILLARETGLAAANEKLRAMQAAKRQLEVDIENMKARIEMVKVAEATSSAIAFDDSRLSRTRDALKDIGARIEVAEKMVAANTTMPDQIALDEVDSKNISEEIAKHFGERPASEDVVKLD